MTPPHMSSSTVIQPRHRCGYCNRFVKEASVRVWFDNEDNCSYGSGSCIRCGHVDLYINHSTQQVSPRTTMSLSTIEAT